jgi:PncC family amidohydrolase
MLSNCYNLFIYNDMQLETKIAKQLTKLNRTIACAESCTGGLLAHRLTNIPGSSLFFMLGVVTYHANSKIRILKIPAPVVKRQGVVSPTIAKRMAQGVRRLAKTDYGVGITGNAGPSPTENKPVGEIHIAVCSKKTIHVQSLHFKGSRLQNKTHAVNAALKMLLQMLA